jgi:predicted transcriptional regulator
MPKLDRETLNGKIVVSTIDPGLPPKSTEALHQYFLREDPKTGYIGALHEKDLLQEQSSVLVIDLEKDTSKIAERFMGHVLDCTPDVKAILLEAHLKLLRLYNPDFDVNFLATALTIKTPEKIPILRVAEVIGKMSAVPFQSSDISPIGVTDNFSPKEAYGLSREILKDSVKVSKPLNLEISDNELIVYKALKRLTKSGVKNRNGQAIFEKLEDMKASISRATVYRALDSLVKQGILQKLKDSSYERMEGEIGYDQFPRLKLPTVEELFPVGNSVAQDPMNPSDANHPVSCEVEGGGEPPQSGEVIQENLQP